VKERIEGLLKSCLTWPADKIIPGCGILRKIPDQFIPLLPGSQYASFGTYLEPCILPGFSTPTHCGINQVKEDLPPVPNPSVKWSGIPGNMP
jgi:hypothetical protein